MPDFSTSAEVSVVVDSGSLSAARREIEDELGATVDVTATPSSQVAGDGGVTQATSGGTAPSESLSISRKTNNRLDDNLELNETRNIILRDILDELENGGAGGGSGLRLPGLGGGLVSLLGGGVALGAVLANELRKINFSQLVSDALPDLTPGDIVDPVAVTAADLIDTGADIATGALIAAGAVISAPDLIADKAVVTIDNLIDDVTGEGSGQGSGQGTGGSGVGGDDLFALGAGAVGSGALAKLLLTGGGGGGLSLPSILGGGAAGAGARGAISLAGLTSGALATAGVAGTVLGGRELAQVASGGEGVEPVADAGRRFGEEAPGVAGAIEGAFTSDLNPFFQAGSAVSSFLEGDAPGSFNAVQAGPRGGTGGPLRETTGPSQQQIQSATVSGPSAEVNANVTVDAEGVRRDLDRELDRLKEDIIREVERALSGGGF